MAGNGEAGRSGVLGGKEGLGIWMEQGRSNTIPKCEEGPT